MILVVGGTGTLGTVVVRGLVESGASVRLLTRDEHRTLPPGVESVHGDVRDPPSLAPATLNCATVISAMHGFVGRGQSPESIDRDGNLALIAAARRAGVKHFVLLSVQGAAADHPMSLHRAKFAAETALRASGLGFTIIRPTAFFETWLGLMQDTLTRGGKALVFGPGRNPINFVSVRDVAALVVLATRDAQPSGETFDISGPENLDFVTVATRLLDARGAPGRIKHIPLPVLRAMSVLARPFSPVFARQARAAVVMNTLDMTCSTRVRERFPSIPSTTLRDLLAADDMPS